MPLNFWKDNADDGTDTNASIQPVSNGDPVEESYLNRAAQNLRKRTEDIRVLLDDLQAISRSDRAFALLAKEDTKIILDEPTSGSGEYRISINSTGNAGNYDRDIVLMPMLSPSKVAAPGPVPARFYYAEDASNGISLTMKDVSGHPRKVSEGSHNIYWQIIKDSNVTSTPIVEIKANDPANPDPEAGPVYIIVKIKADDTSTLSEIADAIDGSAVNTLVASSVNGSAAVTLGGSNSWGPYRAYETDENASVTGFGAQAGVDDEGFVITASAFNDFFVTNARKLKEGDTLFLDLANAKTRMQTTTASIFNDASSLHIISSDERLGTDTRNLGDADGPIPLFKVATPRNASSPMLYCINQKAFALGTSGYLLNSTTETDNIRSELADNSGTPYGDYMVGAEAKSDDILSLSAGTVNSQLKELVALGNQGSGTSGDNSIGAAAHSGTPQSLSAGSVASQMAEMLSYYNDHVKAIADKHKIPEIDGSTFFVIDPNGGGHFTTLQDALTNAQAYGGLYLIKSGTYSENVSLSGSFTKNAIFIGAGSNLSGVDATVTWNSPNGTSPTLNISGEIRANLVFQNIIFDRNFAGQFIYVSESTTDDNYTGVLRFEDCEFRKTAADSTNDFIFIRCSAEFRNCNFIGYAFTENIYCIHCESNFSGAPAFIPSVHVHDCSFSKWGKILYSLNLARTVFSKNSISHCGNAPDGEYLIYVSGSNVEIVNNRYFQVGDENPDNRTLFCSVSSARGIIGGNYISPGYQYTAPVFMLTASGLSDRGLSVVGNTISAGSIGGINGSNCCIDKNTISFAPSDTANHAILSNDNSVISANTIYCGTFPAGLESIVKCGTGDVVSQNRITNINENGVSVFDLSSNQNITLSENYTEVSSTSTVGSLVTSSGAQNISIVNNEFNIQGTLNGTSLEKAGILIDGSNFIIKNNVISVGTLADTAKLIYANGQSDFNISGNTFTLTSETNNNGLAEVWTIYVEKSSKFILSNNIIRGPFVKGIMVLGTHDGSVVTGPCENFAIIGNVISDLSTVNANINGIMLIGKNPATGDLYIDPVFHFSVSGNTIQFPATSLASQGIYICAKEGSVINNTIILGGGNSPTHGIYFTLSPAPVDIALASNAVFNAGNGSPYANVDVANGNGMGSGTTYTYVDVNWDT